MNGMNEQLLKTSGTDVLSSKKKTQKNLMGGGKMLSTKGKIVSKYCNLSKTPGRGSSQNPPPPPPHLIPQWGYEYGSGIAFPVPKTKHVAFMYLTELKEL